MYLKFAKRLLLETDKRLLWKLAYNGGVRGLGSVLRFRSRLRKGEYFPPFLFISVINSCNLRCQGCWVDVSAKKQTMDLGALDRLIAESKGMGNSIFGILGGEPFLYPEVLDVLGRHPDCYFQIFTNGQLITRDLARAMRKIGNVTPLISVEGNQFVSDERRGRTDVYARTFEGLENCLAEKLITGVCTSLCQTNYDDFVREEWVDRLIQMRVMYMWFHVYRPVGPEPNADLSLTPEQQLRARRFVVDMRVKKPIIIVDAYFDHDGKAICPAASGLTHHISPWGDIEPCPIIQIAKESIHDPRGIRETFRESGFLHDFRELAATTTRGCIVLERPDLLLELAVKHGAKDTTVRQQVVAELSAMTPRSSQFNPDQEVPEKSWAYWIAKRLGFHDFGAYAKFDRARETAASCTGDR